jgi:hypothetical protein
MPARARLLGFFLLLGCADPGATSRDARRASGTFPFDSDIVRAPWVTEGGPARRHDHHGSAEHFVFINMDGVNLTCDEDDATRDRSILACQGLGDIGEFDPRPYDCGDLDECKTEVVRRLNDAWNWDEETDTPLFNVTFTTERPESGEYEMVVVGELGIATGGALGVAPLDCGDMSPVTVSFAFSDAVAYTECTLDVLNTTISQELAHALGLCHIDNTDGIMYPAVVGCTADWSCGDAGDNTCYCTGLGYDPYCPSEYLEELLGTAEPDTTPPSVSILRPQNRQTIPRDFQIDVRAEDDRSVASLRLFADGGAEPATTRDQVAESGMYEFPATHYPLGEHEFCVEAADGSDNVARDCITVTVDDVDCTPGAYCCYGAHCCSPDDESVERGELGDACTEVAGCCSGICAPNAQGAEGGVCTEECKPSAAGCNTDECPPGFSCRASGSSYVCTPYALPRGIGWPCSDADDCGETASRCARVARDAPDGGVDEQDLGFCTADCDPAVEEDAAEGEAGATAVCPGGFRCVEAAEGRHVCRRACDEEGEAGESAVSGGCAVAASGAAWPALAWLGLLAARRRCAARPR